MKRLFSCLSYASWGLCLSTIMLILCGLLMVYNTTSAEALDFEMHDHLRRFFFKQLSYLFVGLLLGIGVVYIGIDTLYENIQILFALLTIILLLILIPKVGMEINGARRWIKIMGVSVQPSEFAKIIIPIYFIKLSLNHSKEAKQFFSTAFLIAIPLFLILVEPDNGTVAIIFSTLFALCFLLKIPMKFWLLPVVILMTIGGSYAARLPHVHDRIRIYLHPEDDLLGKGHQPFQAKIATGSGGLTGRGLGKSLQKLNYLPEARSDYIAAIFAEEFGFLGMLALISLYLLLLSFAFYIAFYSLHTYLFYIASFLTFIIGIQAFLNLGVVSGLLPSKGTNLPFFSQGGSSLCANIVIIALLINIDYIANNKKHPIFVCKRLS